MWLGSCQGYRNLWRIDVSPTIALTEGWYYNYTGDRLRLSLREAGTAFGLNLNKPLVIYFYGLSAVPANDTYRIFVKRK